MYPRTQVMSLSISFQEPEYLLPETRVSPSRNLSVSFQEPEYLLPMKSSTSGRPAKPLRRSMEYTQLGLVEYSRPGLVEYTRIGFNASGLKPTLLALLIRLGYPRLSRFEACVTLQVQRLWRSGKGCMREAHSDRVGTSLAHPSSSSTSSDEESLFDVPFHSGYEWVDSGVREYFSKYKWYSSIRRFAEAYAILDEDSPDEAVSLDRVGRVDNACHGREGYSDEFFYICTPTHGLLYKPLGSYVES
ncbi:hypothetical protein DEO72_LG8g1202 [Vigna unguiculata]|uniref:Uncharacterized protein n=1 Tax=Vigna unguiculata TaxID=3917 RepID=A0A4D6MNT1_VIGUN|nr:hypothetical protein DEO72_LG8g1202 [Vigna unguiculata]